jgi:hypothetical protein
VGWLAMITPALLIIPLVHLGLTGPVTTGLQW